MYSSNFSDEFVKDILALLDLIEIQEDSTLAAQRFEIARKHGLTVTFEEPVSGKIN